MADSVARVAMASQYPAEDGIMFSGVQGVVAALADGLAAAGLEVHVVTCEGGIRQVRRRTTQSGVAVHSVPSPGKLAWLVGFPVETHGIRSVLREIGPDIVHCHTQTVYAHAALERGWPSVLTIHGIYAREVGYMRGWRRFQGRLLTRFERDAYRRAKHVICISEYLRREMGGALAHKEARLIENPVDDRFFGVPAGSEEPGRILYAGTVINRKRLLVLLEAVRLMVSRGLEVRLRVAGSQVIEPDYHARCVQFVNDNELSRSVDFLGAIAVNGLRDELANANALVLPSRQETAPMVVSEAMASGTPAVVTPAGGTADMVEDGKAGFVVPFDDASSLADAIERLLCDSTLRESMSNYSRKIATQRYKLSSVVKKTVAFYNEIAEVGAL